MADDQALWDQFLAQFRAEYADTQRGDRARETIDNIKMKGIAIDQYISDFVRLAEDAQYDLGATGTWRFFLRGLPKDVGVEVIKANPQDWATLRQTAIDATNAWNRINIAFGDRFSSLRTRANQSQRPPFRSNQQNWRQNTSPTQTPRPQYNSSNAPRNFNNVPVPMDTSARARTNRRGLSRSNVAQTRPSPDLSKVKCFNCDEKGHISRNCPKPRRSRIAGAESADLLSEADGETLVDYTPMPSTSSTSPQEVIRAYQALSLDEKQQFVDELSTEDNQGFPTV